MRRTEIVEINNWDEYQKLSEADKQQVQDLFSDDEEAIKEFLDETEDGKIGLF